MCVDESGKLSGTMCKAVFVRGCSGSMSHSTVRSVCVCWTSQVSLVGLCIKLCLYTGVVVAYLTAQYSMCVCWWREAVGLVR